MRKLLLLCACALLVLQQGIGLCEDTVSCSSSNCRHNPRIRTGKKILDHRVKETNRLKNKENLGFLDVDTEYIKTIINYLNKNYKINQMKRLKYSSDKNEYDIFHKNNVHYYEYYIYNSDNKNDLRNFTNKASVRIESKGHKRTKTSKKTRTKTKKQPAVYASMMHQGKRGKKRKKKSRLMRLLERIMFHNTRLGPVLSLISTMMTLKTLGITIGTLIVTSLRFLLDFTY